MPPNIFLYQNVAITSRSVYSLSFTLLQLVLFHASSVPLANADKKEEMALWSEGVWGFTYSFGVLVPKFQKMGIGISLSH